MPSVRGRISHSPFYLSAPDNGHAPRASRIPAEQERLLLSQHAFGGSRHLGGRRLYLEHRCVSVRHVEVILTSAPPCRCPRRVFPASRRIFHRTTRISGVRAFSFFLVLCLRHCYVLLPIFHLPLPLLLYRIYVKDITYIDVYSWFPP